MSCSCKNSCETAQQITQKDKNTVLPIVYRFILSAISFTAGVCITFFIDVSISPILRFIPVLLFVVSWAISGFEVVFSALKNALKGDFFDENFLMTIATIGAFAIGEVSEAAAVMLFFNIGELLQEYAVQRSRRSITDLVDIRVNTARVVRNGEETEVNPQEVRIGEIIRVRSGEKVPLDGTVISGVSVFDTASLTGESVPREAYQGVQALSGFLNGQGLLEIKVEKDYENSTATKILELIENASNKKANTEKFITVFAKKYTPIVVCAALVLALIPPIFTGGNFSDWIYRALVFLVISCPCAFVVAVPLGFFGGIGGAAKHGILVKGTNYLEILAKVSTVVFDKTGTLTKGNFIVKKIIPVQPQRDNSLHMDENNLLRYAALAELKANHPAATALIDEAKKRGIELHNEYTAFSEQAGFGISATIEQQYILVGNERLLAEHAVILSSDQKKLSAQETGTIVHIALNTQYAGCIILGDELKPESVHAIAELKKLHITKTVLLSGDTKKTAEAVAKELNIDEVQYELLPHDKVAHFEKIKVQAKEKDPKSYCAFVGDGVNDAPVITISDVGFAMGALGSDAAVEAADIVLMNDNPLSISQAIRIARFTMHIVKQNITLSFIIKILFLGLGVLGIANLWTAVFADVGVALLATANSLRALHFSE